MASLVRVPPSSAAPPAASLRNTAPVSKPRASAVAENPASPFATTDDAEAEPTRAPGSVKPAQAEDRDLLRRRWRSLVGRPPPKNLSHAVTERILTWREQVAEVGDISPRSRALLAAALAAEADGDRQGQGAGQGEDQDDRQDEAQDQGGAPANLGGKGRDSRRRRPHAPIRFGTALIREHAGVLHRVIADAEGFEWQGRTYSSLSAVARAITGVRWNGRRFFGLDRDASRTTMQKKRARTH